MKACDIHIGTNKDKMMIELEEVVTFSKQEFQFCRFSTWADGSQMQFTSILDTSFLVPPDSLSNFR